MSEQLRLDEWTPKGSTIDLDRDKPRLSRQMQLIWNCINGTQEWWTLQELEFHTGFPQASISARLRDFRALGHQIDREFVRRGLHRYRLRKP